MLDQEIKHEKNTLLVLPQGIITTPRWLFRKFTAKSLASHGIKRVTAGHRVEIHRVGNSVAKKPDAEYVIQLDDENVARVTGDMPITYSGFKKWQIEEVY